MIALAVALISGNCYAPVQVRQVQSYQLQQAAYYQVVPLYTPDASAQADRLKATEDAILRLTQVVEQQQLLIQQQGPLLQTSSKYEAAARRILQRSCLSCHSGEKTKGDVDLSGEIGIGLKLLSAELVASEDMPPNKPLLAEDVATIVSWSREDKEAVREHLRGRRETPPPPPEPEPELK